VLRRHAMKENHTVEADLRRERIDVGEVGYVGDGTEARGATSCSATNLAVRAWSLDGYDAAPAVPTGGGRVSRREAAPLVLSAGGSWRGCGWRRSRT
jgi:hypothetical protein